MKGKGSKQNLKRGKCTKEQLKKKNKAKTWFMDNPFVQYDEQFFF